MPGLRLLLRVAPFVVGAVAVGVWLRRCGAKRNALGAVPAGRFQREPVDIVAVVDDLLQAGR